MLESWAHSVTREITNERVLWPLCLFIFFDAWSMTSFCEWRKLTSRNFYFGFYVYLYLFFGAWSMSSFCEWRKLTSRNLYFSFSVYLYSLVPEAWAPSLNGGCWPADISILSFYVIYILRCQKHELLLWVKEANYTNIYHSGSITVPDPDPSIIKQKNEENLDLYCFVTSLWLFILEEWCKCTFKKE